MVGAEGRDRFGHAGGIRHEGGIDHFVGLFGRHETHGEHRFLHGHAVLFGVVRRFDALGIAEGRRYDR